MAERYSRSPVGRRGSKVAITEVGRIVRIVHESWDRRDPDRGAAVIADADHRWRAAFPDGEVTIARQLGLVE